MNRLVVYSFGKFIDSNQAAFQILTNIKYDYPTRVKYLLVTNEGAEEALLRKLERKYNA